MSSLLDHGSRATKVKHTLKHYFSLKESYFQLITDPPSWFEHWNTLRAGQALDPEVPERVDQSEPTRLAADAGYREWFALAQNTVEAAQASGRIYNQCERGDTGQLFVGRAGLITVVQPTTTGLSLITSYRVVPSWQQRRMQTPGSTQAWEVAALARVDKKMTDGAERAAVRRALRRALDELEMAPAASPEPSSGELEP